jgi:pimeloyl-[acyl-carrier protein] methyl ester esterase
MSDLIHYHIKGSGRPLVLIHGWAMHAGVWQGFADHLAEHCMTVAADLRGHGDSRHMAGPYDFEQHARDVAALIKHLGLRDPVLAGWSMGVSIILKMVELGCADARAFLLVSGNASLVQRDDYTSALASVVVKRLHKQVQRDYQSGLNTFLGLLCTGEEHQRCSVDPDYRAAMDVGQCPNHTAALETLACLATEDLRPQLALIYSPTLIVHGECDEICPVGAGRFMHSCIPGARLHRLPDTGHMPFITRRESVVDAVQNFLSAVV